VVLPMTRPAAETNGLPESPASIPRLVSINPESRSLRPSRPWQ
jgi:hypothetical protein